jgi:hypothetical protein
MAIRTESKPNVPSSPTATSGSTEYLDMTFSSITNWAAVLVEGNLALGFERELGEELTRVGRRARIERRSILLNCHQP